MGPGGGLRGRLFTDTIVRLGQIDIVVANAGIELIETLIADVTEADFDRLLALVHKIRSS